MLTSTQYAVYRVEHIILIIFILIAIILSLVNIVNILIRQGKWRTLPLSFLYFFILICLAGRLAISFLLSAEYDTNGLLALRTAQSIAKLGCGVIQTWISLELSLRLWQSMQHNESLHSA